MTTSRFWPPAWVVPPTALVPKSADCLIAAIAIEQEILLVHNDREFLALARVAPELSVYPGQRGHC